MVYYIAHIINNVCREGEYDYCYIPLFDVIQYVGTDRMKAKNAICNIIYKECNYERFEELTDRTDDYFCHDYAFKYIPMKDGKDIELPEGCYGFYYADIEKYYNNEE